MRIHRRYNMLDYSLRGSPIVLRTGIISPRKFVYPPEPAFQLFNAVVRPKVHAAEVRDLQLPLPSRYDSFVHRKRPRPGLPNLKHVDIGKRKSIRDIEEIFTPRELEAELDLFAPEVPPTTLSLALPLTDAPAVPERDTTRFDPARFVTPGTTAVLSIRLTPDMPSSTAPPRADLPNLLWGILPTHTAYSVLSRRHVMPLMYKIESLSLHRGKLAMVVDFDRRINVLHLSFPGRSTEDLRHIMGETLYDPLIVVSEWADAPPRAARGSLNALGLPSRTDLSGQRESALPPRLVTSPTSSGMGHRRTRRVQEWTRAISRPMSTSHESEEKTWSARSAISSAITSASRVSSESSSMTSSDEGDGWETASEWTEVDVP